MRVRAKRGFVLAAGLTLALAAGCSSASTSSSGVSSSGVVGGLEKTHLVVVTIPIIQDAGVYLAQKYGYFAQQGLTVTLKEVRTSAAPSVLAGLANGSIDIDSAANYESFFDMEANHKISFEILANIANCDQNGTVVMALPHSGITGPASLMGKTVAVQVVPNIQTIELNEILDADGLNPLKVHYVPVTFPDMATALLTHKVDAVSIVEPFETELALRAGAVDIMSQCEGPTADLPQAGDIATTAWVAKYPRTALAFQRAVDEAQELISTDRPAVEQIMPTYIPDLTKEITALVDLGVYPISLQAAPIQRVIDMMVANGIIRQGQLNLSSMLFNYNG
jgi:NitT/TauT family transport system substrate-binding protein